MKSAPFRPFPDALVALVEAAPGRSGTARPLGAMPSDHQTDPWPTSWGCGVDGAAGLLRCDAFKSQIEACAHRLCVEGAFLEEQLEIDRCVDTLSNLVWVTIAPDGAFFHGALDHLIHRFTTRS